MLQADSHTSRWALLSRPRIATATSPRPTSRPPLPASTHSGLPYAPWRSPKSPLDVALRNRCLAALRVDVRIERRVRAACQSARRDGGADVRIERRLLDCFQSGRATCGRLTALATSHLGALEHRRRRVAIPLGASLVGPDSSDARRTRWEPEPNRHRRTQCSARRDRGPSPRTRRTANPRRRRRPVRRRKVDLRRRTRTATLRSRALADPIDHGLLPPTTC